MTDSRYQSDPEFRARKLQESHDYYHKRISDPEFRARINEISRKSKKRRRADPEIAARDLERRRQPKQKIIQHYGSKCNCPGCHVVHAELLTIDHVNGDGASHKKETGRSDSLYRWIIRNNFPDSIQLPCGSCNLAKGTKDKCPLAGVDH